MLTLSSGLIIIILCPNGFGIQLNFVGKCRDIVCTVQGNLRGLSKAETSLSSHYQTSELRLRECSVVIIKTTAS